MQWFLYCITCATLNSRDIAKHLSSVTMNTWNIVLRLREYMPEEVRGYPRRCLQQEFPAVYVFGRFLSVKAISFKLMGCGNTFFPLSCISVPMATRLYNACNIVAYLNPCQQHCCNEKPQHCAACVWGCWVCYRQIRYCTAATAHHKFQYPPRLIPVCVAYTDTCQTPHSRF